MTSIMGLGDIHQQEGKATLYQQSTSDKNSNRMHQTSCQLIENQPAITKISLVLDKLNKVSSVGKWKLN